MIKNNLYNFAKMNLEDLSILPFVKLHANYILVSVYIQPNANETTIVGLHNSRLKIKVAVLPTDGKANKTLCNFIAKQFSVPISKVTILKGENTRIKMLKVDML